MKPVVEINAVVLTVSDTRNLKNDSSGAALVELLSAIGALAEREIVTDDTEKIVEALKKHSARTEINLILTTGGTGISPRDNTPEATKSVIEKEVSGISEAMRAQTFAKTPTAMLSRGVSGVLQNTLIINLPGSEKAVRECFAVIREILPHAVNLIQGNTQH